MEITFNDSYRTRTITINDYNSGIVQHYGSVEMFFQLYADDIGNMCSYFKDDDPRIALCLEKLDYWLLNEDFTPNKSKLQKAIMNVVYHTNKELRQFC